MTKRKFIETESGQFIEEELVLADPELMAKAAATAEQKLIALAYEMRREIALLRNLATSGERQGFAVLPGITQEPERGAARILEGVLRGQDPEFITPFTALVLLERQVTR